MDVEYLSTITDEEARRLGLVVTGDQNESQAQDVISLYEDSVNEDYITTITDEEARRLGIIESAVDYFTPITDEETRRLGMMETIGQNESHAQDNVRLNEVTDEDDITPRTDEEARRHGMMVTANQNESNIEKNVKTKNDFFQVTTIGTRST